MFQLTPTSMNALEFRSRGSASVFPRPSSVSIIMTALPSPRKTPRRRQTCARLTHNEFLPYNVYSSMCQSWTHCNQYLINLNIENIFGNSKPFLEVGFEYRHHYSANSLPIFSIVTLFNVLCIEYYGIWPDYVNQKHTTTTTYYFPCSVCLN